MASRYFAIARTQFWSRVKEKPSSVRSSAERGSEASLEDLPSTSVFLKGAPHCPQKTLDIGLGPPQLGHDCADSLVSSPNGSSIDWQRWAFSFANIRAITVATPLGTPFNSTIGMSSQTNVWSLRSSTTLATAEG